MEIANVMVALGGSRGHTVPKTGITPAEIMVLQALHGDEAVFDVEPAGEVDRSRRAEREELILKYPGRQTKPSPVTQLFPSITASDMPVQLAELIDLGRLDDSLMKAIARVKAPPLKPAEAKRGRRTAEPPPESGRDAVFE